MIKGILNFSLNQPVELLFKIYFKLQPKLVRRSPGQKSSFKNTVIPVVNTKFVYEIKLVICNLTINIQDPHP